MAPFCSPRSSSHRPSSSPRTAPHQHFYTPPPHGLTNRYRPLATNGIPSERLALVPEYVLDPTPEMHMEYLRASQAASDGGYFLTFDRRHNTVERVERPAVVFGRTKPTMGGARLLTFLSQNTLLCAHAANPMRSDQDCRIDVQNRVWIGDACVNVLGAKHNGVLCEYYVNLAPSRWIPRIYEDEDSDNDDSPLPSLQGSSSTSASSSSSSGSTSTLAESPAKASPGRHIPRPMPDELMQFLAAFTEVMDDKR